ncbi:MAG TPA: thioesterase family protein [Roseiarcus sp.]|nr:thioesterase family protein [Roseiarcus sp.]
MSFRIARRLTIEWGHCDPAGIVFNPRFFEFFDWSTALLLREALGIEKAKMRSVYGVAGVPLVDTHAIFHRPARYGDDVEIVSTVAAVGRSSFDVQHMLYNQGELAVEAREKRVWVVEESDGRLRSQRMPKEVAARLRGDAVLA